MANNDNLKPILSESEAREKGSKGGKASAEARRKRKAFKEQLEILLKLPINNPDIKEKIEGLGLDSNEIDYQMAMNVAIFQEAVKGNTKAYEIIRDTIGEKPIEQVNVNNSKATQILDSINQQLRKKNK